MSLKLPIDPTKKYLSRNSVRLRDLKLRQNSVVTQVGRKSKKSKG